VRRAPGWLPCAPTAPSGGGGGGGALAATGRRSATVRAPVGMQGVWQHARGPSPLQNTAAGSWSAGKLLRPLRRWSAELRPPRVRREEAAGAQRRCRAAACRRTWWQAEAGGAGRRGAVAGMGGHGRCRQPRGNGPRQNGRWRGTEDDFLIDYSRRRLTISASGDGRRAGGPPRRGRLPGGDCRRQDPRTAGIGGSGHRLLVTPTLHVEVLTHLDLHACNTANSGLPN